MNSLKEAVIYWIRLRDHVDIHSEGYIGVTKSVNRCINNYKLDISRGKHANKNLTSAVRKNGWENIVVEEILCGTESYCYFIEGEMRPKPNIGWNMASGGHRRSGRPAGFKMSEESIQKAKENRAKSRLLRLPEIQEEKRRKEEERLKKKIIQKEERLQERQRRESAYREEKNRNARLRTQSRRDKKKESEIKNSRPICGVCQQHLVSINYVRKGKTHYRSVCNQCLKKGRKLLPPKPRWQIAGYKKKQSCDRCGFRKRYDSQLLVYHIDGNLNNVAETNLRTVCLNCSVDIAKTGLPWQRGDLEADNF
jgi:hypothetical protein